MGVKGRSEFLGPRDRPVFLQKSVGVFIHQGDKMAGLYHCGILLHLGSVRGAGRGGHLLRGPALHAH